MVNGDLLGVMFVQTRLTETIEVGLLAMTLVCCLVPACHKNWVHTDAATVVTLATNMATVTLQEIVTRWGWRRASVWAVWWGRRIGISNIGASSLRRVVRVKWTRPGFIELRRAEAISNVHFAMASTGTEGCFEETRDLLRRFRYTPAPLLVRHTLGGRNT
jgi:hypothetical protein